MILLDTRYPACRITSYLARYLVICYNPIFILSNQPLINSCIYLNINLLLPGIKLEASIGIPMPRFAYIPSSNSKAARRTIFSLILAAAEGALASPEQNYFMFVCCLLMFQRLHLRAI